jgi:hypothetical protein
MSSAARIVALLLSVASCTAEDPLAGPLDPCAVDEDCESGLQCIDVSGAPRCTLPCDEEADCSNMGSRAECDLDLGVCVLTAAPPVPY